MDTVVSFVGRHERVFLYGRLVNCFGGVVYHRYLCAFASYVRVLGLVMVRRDFDRARDVILGIVQDCASLPCRLFFNDFGL